MKRHGHYCKVCGEYKANEKFSGKGHAAHICKTCAAFHRRSGRNKWQSTGLSICPALIKGATVLAEKQSEEITPGCSGELAQEQLEMRFPSRQEPEDFEDDSEFLLDEEIEQNNTRRSVKAGRFLFEKGGVFMATTRIMPLHVGKGRTESSATLR